MTIIDLDKLRSILEQRKPQEVADAVGVHVNTIRNIINGTHSPRYDLVVKIWEYLNG